MRVWSIRGEPAGEGGPDLTIASGVGAIVGRSHAESYVFDGSVYCARYSADGSLIASGSHDGYVRVFSPETGDTLSELRGHGGPVKSIDWCEMRGGERAYVFASASADGDARIWTVQGARAVR